MTEATTGIISGYGIVGYGCKSRYYIDPTVKTKKCRIIKKADPKLVAFYRANKERIDSELRKNPYRQTV